MGKVKAGVAPNGRLQGYDTETGEVVWTEKRRGPARDGKRKPPSSIGRSYGGPLGRLTLTPETRVELIRLMPECQYYTDVIRAFEASTGQKIDPTTFARWMNDERTGPSLMAAWEASRKHRGHIHADKALKHAEEAKEYNVQSQRLKVDTERWAAGCNHPDFYGKQTKITGDPDKPLAILVDTGIRRDEDEKPPEITAESEVKDG